MENLSLKTFKMKDSSKQNLIRKGFRWHGATSGDDVNIYYYRFPLMKYKSFVCVEAEILVTMNNGDVQLNVYGSDRKPYSPFYNNISGFDFIVKMINRKIYKKFEEFNIRENG